ncbi:uncharacterized protein PG998_007382 [Apiospora kogelbergensis]|uniref:uncharacterized protein n=1 Tax=Apiospora kogelbergensis TaxID=1337665 RepID=UPI00312DD4E7
MTVMPPVQYASFHLQPLQYRSTLHLDPLGRTDMILNARPRRGVPDETVSGPCGGRPPSPLVPALILALVLGSVGAGPPSASPTPVSGNPVAGHPGGWARTGVTIADVTSIKAKSKLPKECLAITAVAAVIVTNRLAVVC